MVKLHVFIATEIPETKNLFSCDQLHDYLEKSAFHFLVILFRYKNLQTQLFLPMNEHTSHPFAKPSSTNFQNTPSSQQTTLICHWLV